MLESDTPDVSNVPDVYWELMDMGGFAEDATADVARKAEDNLAKSGMWLEGEQITQDVIDMYRDLLEAEYLNLYEYERIRDLFKMYEDEGEDPIKDLVQYQIDSFLKFYGM